MVAYKTSSEQRPRANIKQVVNYLNRAFVAAQYVYLASASVRTNVAGTTLHRYQVEFCHLINEIQRGPIYISSKQISLANELIADLEKETD